MPDELWTEVHDIVQETGIKTIPIEMKCKKAKWLPGEFLLKDQLLFLWESPYVLFVVFPLVLLIFVLSFDFCSFDYYVSCGVKVGKTTSPFRHDLNQIPYDYTVEVRNRFKGLDLTECLMNYGLRFMTLYRRQGSRPSP